MKNIFETEVTQGVIGRIEKLLPNTSAQWGKMNVSQMLAHCNVTYEMVFTDKHKKPNGIMRFILKSFVKNVVVNESPYKPNNKTAPAFIIIDERNFELEKKRLIEHLVKTQQLGESHFDNKESLSFGVLNKTEWNNMFYKHLDHHLKQFGV